MELFIAGIQSITRFLGTIIITIFCGMVLKALLERIQAKEPMPAVEIICTVVLLLPAVCQIVFYIWQNPVNLVLLLGFLALAKYCQGIDEKPDDPKREEDSL